MEGQDVDFGECPYDAAEARISTKIKRRYNAEIVRKKQAKRNGEDQIARSLEKCLIGGSHKKKKGNWESLDVESQKTENQQVL